MVAVVHPVESVTANGSVLMNSEHDANKTAEGKKSAAFPGVGDVLEERYGLVKLIGQGEMGTVFQARDLDQERSVAIKLMHRSLADDPEFVKRFKREMKITRDLIHLNSIRVYDFGVTEDGVMYQVMELLEGNELTDEIAGGPMTIDRIIGVGQQLLDGLGEAHAMAVVHRDLKPGNIFLATDWRGRERIKILDFGIAKSMESGATAITKDNELIGTGRYLAPEVFLNGEMSKQSDIYACGLILLEMLYGRPLVDGESVFELVRRHIHRSVVVPEWLEDHPLVSITRRALATNPAVRFPDAEAMFEALCRIPDTERLDRRLSDKEVAAVFAEFGGPAAGDASEDSDSPTATGPKEVVTVESIDEEAGDKDEEEDETRELLQDYVYQAAQELGEYAEEVEEQRADPTTQLDREYIDDIVSSTRKITNQYGQMAGEKTVELSNARIDKAVGKAYGQPPVSDDPKPPSNIEVSQNEGEEATEDDHRESRDDSEQTAEETTTSVIEDGTVELDDDLLSEMEVAVEEDRQRPGDQVQSIQVSVDESEGRPGALELDSSSTAGERRRTLSQEMVLEASRHAEEPVPKEERGEASSEPGESKGDSEEKRRARRRMPTDELTVSIDSPEGEAKAEREKRGILTKLAGISPVHGIFIGLLIGSATLVLLYFFLQLLS